MSRRVLLMMIALVLLTGTAGAVGEERTPAALTIHFENDLFADTDRYYTNGISIAWARPGMPGRPARWLWAPLGAERWFGGRVSHISEVGQVIATPQDTDLVNPDPDDRPYAAILYMASALHFEQESRVDVVKLIAGVLGPAALGEEAQNFAHRLFGLDEAQGWDYQLGNEPVLNLAWERRYRVRVAHAPDGWGADLLGTGGAMLGNMLTQAQAGMQFRFGYRLPDDFGYTLIRGAGNIPPTCQCWGEGRRDDGRLGVQFFFGMSGNLVARNVTLDGNTFRDSRSVEKEPFFAGAEAGVALIYRRYQLGYAYVIWGREFENQSDNSGFGSLFLSVGF